MACLTRVNGFVGNPGSCKGILAEEITPPIIFIWFGWLGIFSLNNVLNYIQEKRFPLGGAATVKIKFIKNYYIKSK